VISVFDYCAPVILHFVPYCFGVLILYIVWKNSEPESQEHTPEAPTLPEPIRKSMAVRDRIEQAEDRRERLAQWAARQEIEQLCADVTEGRDP
jgi:hypothetical protein